MLWVKGDPDAHADFKRASSHVHWRGEPPDEAVADAQY